MLQEKDLQMSEQQNGLGLSASTFNCITCSESKWCLYQISVRNQLPETKFQRRLNFACSFIRKCQTKTEILLMLLL